MAYQGQLGDQFGLVNTLFGAIGLCAIILTMRYQAAEVRAAQLRHIDALGIEERRHRSILLNSRLDALRSHYRNFFEQEYYRSTRGLAWCACQRAISEPEFAEVLRKFWSTSTKSFSEPIRGTFRIIDDNLDEDGNRRVYSWNVAVHRLDDLMSFFSLLASEIRSLNELVQTEDESRQVTESVRRFNIYWDEWGPLLRKICSITKEWPGESIVPDPTPPWETDFDLLDQYYFGSFGWSRLDSTNANAAAVEQVVQLCTSESMRAYRPVSPSGERYWLRAR